MTSNKSRAIISLIGIICTVGAAGYFFDIVGAVFAFGILAFIAGQVARFR